MTFRMKVAAVFVASGCVVAEWAWSAGLWWLALLLIAAVAVWLLRDPEETDG